MAVECDINGNKQRAADRRREREGEMGRREKRETENKYLGEGPGKEEEKSASECTRRGFNGSRPSR